MEDNSTHDLKEQLIKYLDNELSNAEKLEVERLLNNNDNAKNIYQNLLIAKDIVRNVGLRAKVKVLNDELLGNQSSASVPETNIHTKVVAYNFPLMTALVVKIAAVVILVIASLATYKYLSTTSEKLYTENFIEYRLPVNRGSEEQTSQVDSLYNSGNYSELNNVIANRPSKTQEDEFLLGLSYLKTDQPLKALQAFQQVRSLNKALGENYFDYETDYYILLAYIKSKQINEAKKQLSVILADKSNPYYQKAKDISKLDLNILDWKH